MLRIRHAHELGFVGVFICPFARRFRRWGRGWTTKLGPGHSHLHLTSTSVKNWCPTDERNVDVAGRGFVQSLMVGRVNRLPHGRATTLLVTYRPHKSG